MVHGGIDGFSRLVVFLKCATNNRAETVVSSFIESTRKYGIPSRVRSNYGEENTEVGRFMESMRGRNRGSHIQGSSVHNQRIERLHRDTTRCCLSGFYAVFDYMENEGILDPSNDTDVFCLHYVFLPRINRALERISLRMASPLSEYREKSNPLSNIDSGRNERRMSGIYRSRTLRTWT